MSDWLDPEEYVHLAPDSAGQVNVPHEGCTDKPKLYIKRTEDDVILAWCHKCRRKGKHTERGTRNVHKLKTSHKPVVENVEIPSDGVLDINEWPKSARLWVLRYGITEEELNEYNIFYSPSNDRVIIPCRADNGDLLGWQGRDTEQTRKGSPKYLTQRKSTSSFYFKAKKKRDDSSGTGNCRTLVITEDALSSIKSSRICDAIAILGVWLPPHEVAKIAPKYDTVVIYLDNDNTNVIKQQENIKKLFKLFGCRVVVHRGDRDPKELSNEELKEVLSYE